jgi:hypothetical protein
MKKEYWIVIGIVLALIVFFFPKHYTQQGMLPPNYPYREMHCFGIRTDGEPVLDAANFVCYGIPYYLSKTTPNS